MPPAQQPLRPAPRSRKSKSPGRAPERSRALPRGTCPTATTSAKICPSESTHSAIGPQLETVPYPRPPAARAPVWPALRTHRDTAPPIPPAASQERPAKEKPPAAPLPSDQIAQRARQTTVPHSTPADATPVEMGVFSRVKSVVTQISCPAFGAERAVIANAHPQRRRSRAQGAAPARCPISNQSQLAGNLSR